MIVGKIVQPQNFPVFSRMLDSPLWSRKAEDFSPIDLDLLYATTRRYTSAVEAQRACDVVVLKLKTAQLGGKVRYVRVEQKNYVRPLLAEAEFQNKMSQFTQVRQDCLTFALEMNWTINQAVGLERSEVKLYQYEINDRAWEIIDRQPASMFKKTLFWETVQSEQRMLLSLTHQFCQVFQTEWQHLLRQYDRSTGKFVEGITKEEALNAILQRE